MTMLLRRLSLATSFSKSQQHRAWVLLGMVGTTPVVALCEKKDKNLADTLLVKDENGNIQWSQSVSQVSKTAFWDDIAQITGNKVNLMYAMNLLFGVFFLSLFLMDSTPVFLR